MFCEHCGNKLAEGTKFCGQCGWPVPDDFLPEDTEPKEANFVNAADDSIRPVDPDGWQSADRYTQDPMDQSANQRNGDRDSGQPSYGSGYIPPDHNHNRAPEDPKKPGRGRTIALLVGLIVAAVAVFLIIMFQLGVIKVSNPISSGSAGSVTVSAENETRISGEDQGASVAQASGTEQSASAAQAAGAEQSASDVQAGDTEQSTVTAAAAPISITVQQVDASAYPEVKLYLDVVNEDTGEVPADLEQTVFYIGREDANAEYVQQIVTEVTQLNGAEALKVDMVADISGSMDGSPLEDAKTVMSSFINSMQFSAGDEVELTTFSNGVHLVEEFTGDSTAIQNSISGLYTEDMTALYDALYTAVTRVASQNGARCVIAFTDGDDNYSDCTMEDVIEVAQRYHIPVFLIGVGDVDASSMQAIADATGGAYYGVNEISSMQDIYDQIYRMEKELYLVSYTDSTGLEITDTANLQISYESSYYKGECTYSYVPNTLISVDEDPLYTDGPEAVVESYMQDFDDAMTNMDFSYISSYLQYGSPIYNEQISYVQRGISEELDSYEILSTEYESDTSAIVTTRETYYYQTQGGPLKLMTQQCNYRVVYDGNEWLMYEFTDLDVLWRINA